METPIFFKFLLAACYRTGDQLTSRRNYTYTQAVRSYLGMHVAKLNYVTFPNSSHNFYKNYNF